MCAWSQRYKPQSAGRPQRAAPHAVRRLIRSEAVAELSAPAALPEMGLSSRAKCPAVGGRECIPEFRELRIPAFCRGRRFNSYPHVAWCVLGCVLSVVLRVPGCVREHSSASYFLVLGWCHFSLGGGWMAVVCRGSLAGRAAALPYLLLITPIVEPFSRNAHAQDGKLF